MKHRAPTTAGAAGAAFLLLLLLLLSASSAVAQDTHPTSQNTTTTTPDGTKNPYGFSPNFNPSMAIIIVVLIAAFFFLGFFSIYIRQCGGDAAASTISAAAATPARSRGLDPDLLSTFPTLVYSEVKSLKIGKGALECAVCLSEFEDSDELRLLPRCSHVFHPECIDEWLGSHVTCPVCRSDLHDITPAKSAAAVTINNKRVRMKI